MKVCQMKFRQIKCFAKKKKKFGQMKFDKWNFAKRSLLIDVSPNKMYKKKFRQYRKKKSFRQKRKNKKSFGKT